MSQALEVALRLQTRGDKWQVLLRGFSAEVQPLCDDDLRAIEGGPRTWQEVFTRMAPQDVLRLDERTMRDIGELIFRRLITGEVEREFRRQEAEALAAGVPLRLVAHVLPERPDSLLRQLPIELLYEHTFWFRRKGVIGVRRPDDADEGEVRFSKQPRAVVAWAVLPGEAPTTDEMSAHAEEIRRVLERARFHVQVEGDCTAERLRRAIEGGCELLYIACHGTENHDSRGQLILADRIATGTELGEWLYAAGQAGQRVQAAVFSVCSSADVTSGSSGMAQHVAGGRGALAALGYRAPVRIVDALPFMEALAGHLARGETFEAAVCEARRAMPPNTPDWALPLLFARERRPQIARAAELPRAERRSSVRPLLPVAPREYFIAREAELAELSTALEQPGVQVLSAGEGGIGKTELARVLAHDADRAGRLVLWQEKPDVEPVRALASLVKHVRPDFQVQPETSAETLRATLCQALGGETGLLVLDDVARGDVVEQLRPGAGWSVLVTSRNADLLPGVQAHTVPPLDQAAAASLLARLVYQQEQLPESFATQAGELLKMLAGVPLLIEAAASQLRDGREMEEVLADLQDGQGDVHGKAAALFQRSLQRLTDKDRLAWYVVAALPTAGARARNLAAALQEPEADADRRLRRLRDRSLVRWPQASPRATMHPLARQIALEQARASGGWPRVQEGTARAIVEETSWCVAPIGSNSEEARRRWAELRQFMNTLQLAHWRPDAPGADDVAAALLHVGLFRQLELPLTIREDLLAEAESRISQTITRARFHQARGDLHHRRDDLDGADQDYARALDLFSTVPDNLGLATVHRARGELRLRRADLDGADQDYTRALELFSAVHDDLGLATVHKARGDLRRRRADLDGADQDYVRALDLFSAVQDNLGLANVHRARGNLRHRRSDLDGADQDYSTALHLFTAVQDNLGLANVHKARGDLRLRRSDLDGSDLDYARALDLFSAVQDNLGLANVHQARGDLHRRRDDFDVADQDYASALHLFTAVQDNLGLANVHQARGDLRRFRDDLDGADQDYASALDLFTALHDNLGLANVYHARGHLRVRRDDLGGADRDYAKAQDLFTAVQSNLGLANIHHARGDLHQRRGDWAGAIAAYLQALPLYEATQSTLGLSNTLVELAAIAAMHGDVTATEQHLQRAEPLAEASHNRYALKRIAELRQWLQEPALPEQ